MTQAKIGRTLADSTPYWPPKPQAPKGAPNILVVLFDDVGFSDFGCYGSPIRTPTIDALAAGGLRYSGFHTTAMCSTTRAALLTGRNHHSVGMGCLANFDSGYPGYRGKIAHEAGTLPEMLRPHGYRNYMVGKWHVTSLTESGPTGPFDGWPLGRGFDRYYGFMDAETDQYAPELVRDNTAIDPPGGYADGYHLTADLVDESIRYLADHMADAPQTPWLLWLAFGACHAPHQAPKEIIESYDPVFAGGWDVERERRLARQKALGIVPADTRLPPRNDGVRAWEELSADEQKVTTRLQSAFAGMLDHADRQLARLVAFLEETGVADDTLILVLSDNGASQEGGLSGFVNAMGPYNLKAEPLAEKLAKLDDIGGPDSHSNFPHGWAMASNTPLRRYKQNTHGGGIRDPLVVRWPNGIAARGEIRPQFAHASDLVPTLLELLGISPPETIAGVAQMPLEGESFAASLSDPAAPPRRRAQYFEMFGHRGLWRDGWKAVAYHPPGTPFEADRWELFHLDADFSETEDLAQAEPERLKALVEAWWAQAEACKVLPLDDRFGPRFAENAARFQGLRKRFVFHAGMGHLPTDVAPDVRSRSYRIEAEAVIPTGGAEGVLIAHGDATSGYSLFVQDGRLHHTLNIGGQRTTVSSERPLAPGPRRLGVAVRQGPDGRSFTLTVDGEAAGTLHTTAGFATLISWSGLDIGRGRSSPVGPYPAPFAFTGGLRKVTVVMDEDQALDGEAVGLAEMARQ
ncbi:arylsulfatase [Phenylobacterium hankyongense]|uniref:Arylsulfatase n=1 Tax=Phenylobacterium hankyongense TaxID=1813876 RepID=A0A328B4P9_9CAUL|nr:sulfatase-like hydrolase/transferase [Phenylobacterium hankyongense]RAK60834.1 arylsulfatase [Phenylobacterium hankyongense]